MEALITTLTFIRRPSNKSGASENSQTGYKLMSQNQKIPFKKKAANNATTNLSGTGIMTGRAVKNNISINS
jgi:hypothetical protein